jgi:hypothetical protein
MVVRLAKEVMTLDEEIAEIDALVESQLREHRHAEIITRLVANPIRHTRIDAGVSAITPGRRIPRASRVNALGTRSLLRSCAESASSQRWHNSPVVQADMAGPPQLASSTQTAASSSSDRSSA